ncbi:MAG: hypothetical protein KC583_02525, partial [Myxococcales bacterium]|nr:hypothetical protein [Myxococcales bacterium]
PARLFGEAIGTVVVATADRDALLALAQRRGVTAWFVGPTGGDRVVITVDERRVVDASVADLRAAWEGALPAVVAARAPVSGGGA